MFISLFFLKVNMQDPIVHDNLSPEAAKAVEDAIHAAKNAAQALELSRATQLRDHEAITRQIVAEAIKEMTGFPSNQELQDSLDHQKKAIEDMSRKLDPIVDVYKAVLLSRSFLIGLSGLVIAITAIGVGFSWLVNSVMHKG